MLAVTTTPFFKSYACVCVCVCVGFGGFWKVEIDVGMNGKMGLEMIMHERENTSNL